MDFILLETTCPRKKFNRTMINIKNKEREECSVLMVDMSGRVCYEAYIQPNDYLDLDIRQFLSGIYTLIFRTTNTSFAQQIVKY
jgi:hypothetical protein